MVAGAFTMGANAQEMLQKSSVIFKNGIQPSAAVNNAPKLMDHKAGLNTASGERFSAKTTSSAGRWYSYSNYLAYSLGTGNFGAIVLGIWNDTSAVFAYSTGSPSNNEWTSLATVFDPYYAPFNDSTLYPNMLTIGATDAYIIDSVAITGWYLRSATNTTDNDHLKFGLVYGDGSSTSNLPAEGWDDMLVTTSFPYVPFGTNRLFFAGVSHDSVNNEAGQNTGVPAPVVTTTVDLTYADSSNNFFKVYAVNPLNVPAANWAAASVSFISGDAGYTPGATVQNSDGSVNYGLFYPAILFKGTTVGTTTTASFPTYDSLNWNAGSFKREGASDAGWGGTYIPEWAWSTGGGTGGSDLQIPEVDFHVTCATCRILGWPLAVKNVNNITFSGVKAYPNPATTEVNIAFNLSQSATATVVLTNMVGQVIATQVVSGVNDVKATFNTSAIPAGMYLYAIQVEGGNHGTGRIVVAH